MKRRTLRVIMLCHYFVCCHIFTKPLWDRSSFVKYFSLECIDIYNTNPDPAKVMSTIPETWLESFKRQPECIQWPLKKLNKQSIIAGQVWIQHPWPWVVYDKLINKRRRLFWFPPIPIWGNIRSIVTLREAKYKNRKLSFFKCLSSYSNIEYWKDHLSLL